MMNLGGQSNSSIEDLQEADLIRNSFPTKGSLADRNSNRDQLAVS